MALKINTELQTNDGGTVTAGTFIRFSTYFPFEGLNYVCSLNYYRSQEAYESGFSKYQPLLLEADYKKELSPEDFISLTPIQVHQNLKDLIEEITGIGSVEIVFV